MRRLFSLSAVLLLSLCLLCSCGANGSGGTVEPKPINEGETYLDGFWYLEEDDLHVGYHLFPDGGGFLFIGETVVPIRYGIFSDSFYVSDNGNVESFPFHATEDGLWIDDMLYRPMAEDPDISAAVESMRAEGKQEEASAHTDSPSQTGKIIAQLVTLAAAVGVVVIIVGYLRKRKKKA